MIADELVLISKGLARLARRVKAWEENTESHRSFCTVNRLEEAKQKLRDASDLIEQAIALERGEA